MRERRHRSEMMAAGSSVRKPNAEGANEDEAPSLSSFGSDESSYRVQESNDYFYTDIKNRQLSAAKKMGIHRGILVNLLS